MRVFPLSNYYLHIAREAYGIDICGIEICEIEPAQRVEGVKTLALALRIKFICHLWELGFGCAGMVPF